MSILVARAMQLLIQRKYCHQKLCVMRPMSDGRFSLFKTIKKFLSFFSFIAWFSGLSWFYFTLREFYAIKYQRNMNNKPAFLRSHFYRTDWQQDLLLMSQLLRQWWTVPLDYHLLWLWQFWIIRKCLGMPLDDWLLFRATCTLQFCFSALSAVEPNVKPLINPVYFVLWIHSLFLTRLFQLTEFWLI